MNRSRLAVGGAATAVLAMAVVVWLWLRPGSPAAVQPDQLVGSAACAGCHQEAYAAWHGSHHQQAMAVASAGSVRGNFNDVSFTHAGITSRFFTRDGGYFVTTDGPDGTPATFRITHTLGIDPLQQYLVQFPDGRLQALSIAWDTRPRAAGGQRWFHLYPQDTPAHEDALHWTGAFQNASARCIGCHTTGLIKGYDPDTQHYATHWQEPQVGCEACHGAGSRHLAWANGDRRAADKGLAVNLAAAWIPAGTTLPIPNGPPTFGAQERVCATCHARRAELQQPSLGIDFHDAYTLSPLLEGLYFADGSMRDEVYETGSFLQSRMHQRHVTCSHCHEPHSAQLRSEGDGLCLQCHQGLFAARPHPAVANTAPRGTCVSCHMPTRTYMGIDVRHDHSLRVPGDKGLRYPHGPLLEAARRNEASIASQLLAYASDTSKPVILRATAVLESARFDSPAQRETATALLTSTDPLLRVGAAAALGRLPPDERLRRLAPLLHDPAKSVRMTAARQLIDLRPTQVPEAHQVALTRLFDEYRASLRLTADLPESLTDLALLESGQGNLDAAERALQRARLLSPRYLPALLNLADLQRARQRDDLAEPLLVDAARHYPESAEARHALGLLHVRTGRLASAVTLLAQAARLAPDNAHYALAHALALIETNQRPGGLAVLRAAARRFGEDPQIRDALAAYSAAQP